MELRNPLALATLGMLLLVPALPSRAITISPEMKKMLLGGDESRGRAQAVADDEGPDNSIDPERYIVGGGDGFQISIIGLPSEEYFPTVNADGNIYDGDLGLIKVGKVPLAQALAGIEKRVKHNLKKRYEIYVALKKTKIVNVTVTGGVANPGTVRLSGTLRILDAIKAANGGMPPRLDENDFRSVSVRNGDSTKTYDLLKFLARQDLDQNPYVYPGDNIRLNPVDSRVYVAGEVMGPVAGWVPLKPGETVGDILLLVTLRRTADSGRILVQQALARSRQDLKQLNAESARSFALGPNDVITFPPKDINLRPDTVVIAGEVKRPGTYPVQPGKNSVAELMRIAGGATELGSVSRAVIIRHHKRSTILEASHDRGSAPGSGLRPSSLQSVRPEVNSSIVDLHNSADYTVIQASGMEEQAVLEDGDEIFIPRKDNFVYVSGNVKSPGAYPYVPGKSLRYYVGQAKGYTSKADTRNVFVLASYHGVTQMKESKNVGEGDVVVVPASVEYKRFSTVYMPILQMIPGLLTLLVIYITNIK